MGLTAALSTDTLGWLVPQSGGEVGKIVCLQGMCVLGSDRRCDLVLAEAGVSANHARIVLTPQGYTIEDLGSANGTWVNQRRILPGHRGHLIDGDHVKLGRVVIMFKGL